MILTAFFKALAQLGDRRFRAVLGRGVGLTVLLLVAFYALFVWTVGWLLGDAVTLPWIGTVSWVDEVVSWAAIPLMIVLSAFLMVPVASAITGLFLDEVADAVEHRHYPHLSKARTQTVSDAIRDSFGFLGVLIAANIVALIIYLTVASLAPFVFWGLNGFLLGREYFTLAASRRMPRADARAMWRSNLPTIWAAGVLMVVPLTIPLVNLLVPVLGAATFTHIVYRLTTASGAR
ncbi:EI24 domain-containing protein [Cognatishimia sp. F0-27]|uniref:EI24 domain-containing protein n=1 Tax=Cognatishimia sp. F0-27 TaxID=2816855 RepID=UPI001D0CC4FF|nr:EI24 domain-containing protein [Cognatishimia sp. F0-27]MCC1494234.1 EI24 domain-containing protein [Cognatishimia sp. F0-27]